MVCKKLPESERHIAHTLIELRYGLGRHIAAVDKSLLESHFKVRSNLEYLVAIL